MNVNLGGMGGMGGHTRVTHNSVCGRLMNSLVGVLIGVVMFLGGIPLLAWNENNYIRVHESLAEGLSNVESVEDVQYLDTSYNGQLVHVAGPLSNVPVLEDAEFGVSVRGVTLTRRVEMYQYKEERHSRKRRDSMGNERTVTTYSYKPTWSSSLIQSRSFDDPSYQNPHSMPFRETAFTAEGVKVGAYSLSKRDLGRLGGEHAVHLDASTLRLEAEPERRALEQEEWEGEQGGDAQDPYGDGGVDWDEEDPAPLNDRRARGGKGRRKGSQRSGRGGGKSVSRGGKGRGRQGRGVARRRGAELEPAAPAARGLLVRDTALYLSEDPANPIVGDARVVWEARSPTAATLVGVQAGSRVKPYKASNGYSVHLVAGGEHTPEEMFETAQGENTMWTWLLRGGGFVLMFIGLRMALEPAVVAPQLIPCIGGMLSSLVACGACVASCSVAFAVALVTIAIAWFVVRPTLSLGLLAVAGVTLLAARALRGGAKSGAESETEKDK